jgi:hypothetical protein
VTFAKEKFESETRKEMVLKEIGDALYICSFPRKGFVIVILYAKTITN